MRTTVKTNFKRDRAPKRRSPNAASKRPGMDEQHLANIRKLPSCLSGKRPCEAHHLRCAGGRGVSLKAEDKWAIPLTQEEHWAVHRTGSRAEFQWFKRHRLNCLELAVALWSCRGDLDAMRRVVEAHRDPSVKMTERLKQKRKAKAIVSLGACIGDFEQWIIDEQRKEKKKNQKPKRRAALNQKG